MPARVAPGRKSGRILTRAAVRLDLFRLSLVTSVLLTGSPAYVRPFGQRGIFWGYDPLDVVANVLLYLPIGFFQSRNALIAVVVRAALLSTTIEAIQLFSAYRFPGVADVLANTLGALLGHIAARRLRMNVHSVRASRWPGAVVMILATVCFAYAEHWVILHSLGSEIAPTAQVLGFGFAFAMTGLTMLQRSEIELRLFAAGVLGFIGGRLLLAFGVYPSLGYSMPVLGCIGGILATWTTRRAPAI